MYCFAESHDVNRGYARFDCVRHALKGAVFLGHMRLQQGIGSKCVSDAHVRPDRAWTPLSDPLTLV